MLTASKADNFKVLFTGRDFHVSLIDGVLGARSSVNNGTGSVDIFCDRFNYFGGGCCLMYRSPDPIITISDPNSSELEIIEMSITMAKCPIDDDLREYVWFTFTFEKNILKIRFFLEESEDDYGLVELVSTFQMEIRWWNEDPQEILIEHPREEYAFLISVKKY